MRLKGILLGVLAIALIGSLGVMWLAPAKLTQAPDITATTLQGEQLELAGLRGRIVHRKTGKLDMPELRGLIPGMLAHH